MYRQPFMFLKDWPFATPSPDRVLHLVCLSVTALPSERGWKQSESVLGRFGKAEAWVAVGGLLSFPDRSERGFKGSVSRWEGFSIRRRLDWPM